MIMRNRLNMTPEAAKVVAAYRGRHVLPTIAGIYGLSAPERAAIGNWRSSKDEDARTFAGSMPALYDSTKLFQSACAK